MNKAEAIEILNKCIEAGYIDASSNCSCIDEDFEALKIVVSEANKVDQLKEKLKKEIKDIKQYLTNKNKTRVRTRGPGTKELAFELQLCGKLELAEELLKELEG